MVNDDHIPIMPKSFEILIVDDDPQSLQILSDILSEEKYHTSTALSGTQALDIIKKSPPNLILMDIIMPEIDGYEVCKILKASPETRDIPIIFITAKYKQEDILKGFAVGAIDYVTKPFNFSELLARVRTHAELKKKSNNEKELISRLRVSLAEHRRAKEALKQAHDNLERLVEERTVELLLKNQQLLEEIEERKRVQTELRNKNIELNAAYQQLTAYGQEVSQKYNELAQSQHALKESEQRLLSLLEGSPIPTFVIGKNHTVIYWNKALENLSKIKAKNVIGTNKHWTVFYGSERPCMADFLVDEATEEIPRWYASKYSKSKLIKEAFEAADFFPTLGKDGKWLRFTAAAIRDSTGNPVGAIETLEDITERKNMEAMLQESETKYRTIFETTSSPTMIIEEDTSISLINNEFEKLSGYSRKEVKGKKSWTEFVVKEDLARMQEYHTLRRIDPDAAPKSYEFRFIRRDGSIRDAFTTVAIIPGTKKKRRISCGHYRAQAI